MLPSSGKPFNQIFLYTLKILTIIIFNSFHILLILDVLTTLKLNAKHRCWLLTLHFFIIVTPTQNSSLQSMCSRVWQMLYSLHPPPPPSIHSPQRFVFQKFQYCPRLSVSRLILDWWIGSFILGINIFVQPKTIFWLVLGLHIEVTHVLFLSLTQILI